jgi:hydroxymethylpyrimidine pyrophosphatase-like HAD family hydrolase
MNQEYLDKIIDEYYQRLENIGSLKDYLSKHNIKMITEDKCHHGWCSSAMAKKYHWDNKKRKHYNDLVFEWECLLERASDLFWCNFIRKNGFENFIEIMDNDINKLQALKEAKEHYLESNQEIVCIQHFKWMDFWDRFNRPMYLVIIKKN